jgi:hypothetical protein
MLESIKLITRMQIFSRSVGRGEKSAGDLDLNINQV